MFNHSIRKWIPENRREEETMQQFADSVDWLLSVDYPYSDKLAQRFYSVKSKYKSLKDIPLEDVYSLVNEFGYGYIIDTLYLEEESVRTFLSFINFIHINKGSRKGFEFALKLLDIDFELSDWYEQTPVGEPHTISLDLVSFSPTKVRGFEVHVLIVDSHSPDGTGEIAERLVKENKNVHFLDVKERGLGLAIIFGYEYALEKLNADVLMQIDADLQHDPNDIPKFLEKIDEGYNYVQGSRFVKGGSNDISAMRRLFSFGSSWVCRLLTGIWQISDFTPSFKAYTKELYLKMDKTAIPWHGTTFLIQPAAIVEAYRAHAKMTEVPIIFRKRGADRSKNEIVNYIIDIIAYGLEVRFSIWGIKFPVLYWARRSKVFIKFGRFAFFTIRTLVAT